MVPRNSGGDTERQQQLDRIAELERRQGRLTLALEIAKSLSALGLSVQQKREVMTVSTTRMLRECDH